MKRLIKLTALLLLATTFFFSTTSCRKSKTKDIHIIRFEQLLFNSADQLQPALQQFSTQYPSPLLPVYPNDPAYMTQLQQFVADPTVRDIYKITTSIYPNLQWLEKEVGSALAIASELDNDIDINIFATYISGLSDYEQRVAVDVPSQSVRISLDHYAVKGMQKYSYFGLPLYIVEHCDSSALAVDIMAAIARQYIAMPDEKDVTMLDIMISEGKVLYFLDQVLPRKDDAAKIRFSQEQLEWMRRNESNVWSYFIQNNLLYEKDFNRYHNFVDEAPKTNAFKDSAPRTTHYIGWQIVRLYMDNTHCSLKELFENTNSQSILQTSQYKP